MESMIIGICGGSGSGKTTLARGLAESLGGKASLICMDSFYKYQPDTTYEQRCLTNYDHPNAIDSGLMVECLKKLKNGEDAQIPVYDFTIHNRSVGCFETVKSNPVIIIEGVLLFAIPEAVKLLDRKIYVDTDADIRLIRRLERDMNERARSFESVKEQYFSTVRPMHLEFVEPFKAIADIIVPEGGKNPAAHEMILGSLLSSIGK